MSSKVASKNRKRRHCDNALILHELVDILLNAFFIKAIMATFPSNSLFDRQFLRVVTSKLSTPKKGSLYANDFDKKSYVLVNRLNRKLSNIILHNDIKHYALINGILKLHENEKTAKNLLAFRDETQTFALKSQSRNSRFIGLQQTSAKRIKLKNVPALPSLNITSLAAPLFVAPFIALLLNITFLAASPLVAPLLTLSGLASFRHTFVTSSNSRFMISETFNQLIISNDEEKKILIHIDNVIHYVNRFNRSIKETLLFCGSLIAHTKKRVLILLRNQFKRALKQLKLNVNKAFDVLSAEKATLFF